MRSTSWKRWATCALALSICVPALLASPATARSSKSLDDCTAFDQEDKDDDKVQFTVHNSCSIPVDCHIEWRVVCAPQSKKRRSVHPSSVKLALSDMSTQSAEASAATCGDDAWTIDRVSWSCTPNDD